MKSAILLPKPARERLKRAGEIQQVEERRRAVDRAIDQARRDHPNCFIQDEEITQPQEQENVS